MIHDLPSTLSALIAGLGVAAAGRAVLGAGRARGLIAVALGVAAGVWVVDARLRWGRPSPDRPPDSTLSALPGASPREGLSGPDACRACHPAEYASWHGSFHRRMTQVATPATVTPHFSGALHTRGFSVEIETRADGTLWAHVLAGPSRERGASRQIVMTTGSHHLQNYWMAERDGWYTQLPFAWLSSERRFVPTQDTFLQPNSPELEFPSVWNDSCIYCHSVGGAGGLDESKLTADTRVGSLGITCEGCHGDGAAHARAQRSPARRYARHLGAGADDDPIVHPGALPPDRAIAVCGQCHGVFMREDYRVFNRAADGFRPGDALSPSRSLLLPITDPLEPDRLLLPPRDGAPIPVIVRGADGQARDAALVGVGPRGAVLAGPLPPGPATVETRDGRLRGHLVSAERPTGHAPLPLSRLEIPLSGPDDQLPETTSMLGWRGQLPILYDLDGFWADGTSRSTGREANALARTDCATAGTLTCATCHAMHEYADPADMLRADLLSKPGGVDSVCTDCHPAQVGPGHSHHPFEAATCMDCHMPYTTFGLLGGIRAHRIDSPTAAMSAIHGRPNACNLCHLDAPLSFTAEWLERWYAQTPPTLEPADRAESAAARWLLQGDAVVRGVAAFAFGWRRADAASGVGWRAALLTALLDDDYAAVRKVAYDALRRLPDLAALEYDFVGPPEARRATLSALRRRLEASPLDRVGEAIYIYPDGAPGWPEIDARYERRDRRPVVVSE